MPFFTQRFTIMPTFSNAYTLPPYNELETELAPFGLPMSLSQLHGLLCGYSCANEHHRAQAFLNALINTASEPITQSSKTLLFLLLTTAEQDLLNLDFNFQLLLPNEEETLVVRAQAFSEWCEGFLQGFSTDKKKLHTAEVKQILNHFREFAKLDYTNLSVDEADEAAFMEVYEYTRMAVISLKLENEDTDKKPKIN